MKCRVCVTGTLDAYNLLKWRQEFHFNVVCQTERRERVEMEAGLLWKAKRDRQAAVLLTQCTEYGVLCAAHKQHELDKNSTTRENAAK